MASSSSRSGDSAAKEHDARRKSLRLQRTTIERKPNEGRKNPNSLRFVIGLIIAHMHDGQQTKAVEAFKKASGRYISPHRSAEHSVMNTKALAEILSDTTSSQYWHLEAIAESLQIPTGALLIISRLYATMSLNDLSSAGELISGVRAFADCLEAMVEERDLNKEHLEKIISSFSKFHALERQQPGLFD